MDDERFYLKQRLPPRLEVQIHRELELRHLVRFGLGVATLIATLVMMPYLQEALDTIETAQEQVESLDTNWNTVGLEPGQHHADDRKAGKGDTITVQFLVTVPLVVDRDGSIDFYIFDEANYGRYSNQQAATALREEQDKASGTLSVTAPVGDRYYIVFDNRDDLFFEPEEELKYRLVIYTTVESSSQDPLVTAVLLIPSLVLIVIGAWGYLGMRSQRLFNMVPVLMPTRVVEELKELLRLDDDEEEEKEAEEGQAGPPPPEEEEDSDSPDEEEIIDAELMAEMINKLRETEPKAESQGGD